MKVLKHMIKNIMNPVLYDATNPKVKKKKFVISKELVEEIIK